MTCPNQNAWRRRSALVTALCTVILAAACSSNGTEEEAKGPQCPGVGVLADAAKLANFSSSEVSMSDIVYRAEIVNAAATCDIDDDHVDLALGIQVHAFRARPEAAVIYPARYFVAVVDAKERILAKEYFDLAIAFEGSQQQRVLRDSIDEIRIPIESEEAAASYEVLVGFELTRDQVIYNRVTSGLTQGGGSAAPQPGTSDLAGDVQTGLTQDGASGPQQEDQSDVPGEGQSAPAESTPSGPAEDGQSGAAEDGEPDPTEAGSSDSEQDGQSDSTQGSQ